MDQAQQLEIHFLRSRVAVIKGYAQLLQLRVATPGRDASSLSILNLQQLAQIDRLVDQLGALERLLSLPERSRTMRDATPEQHQMTRKHVFAVNSSPDFLDIVRTLLQDEHYNVTTTNFVPRTFDQIAALQPDLLLIDLVVGERAGWDLLENLHREAVTHGIPVIITSTDERLMDRAEQERARFGGQRTLVKPFDLDQLVTAVRELIGGATPPASPAGDSDRG